MGGYSNLDFRFVHPVWGNVECLGCPWGHSKPLCRKLGRSTRLPEDGVVAEENPASPGLNLRRPLEKDFNDGATKRAPRSNPYVGFPLQNVLFSPINALYLLPYPETVNAGTDNRNMNFC